MSKTYILDLPPPDPPRPPRNSERWRRSWDRLRWLSIAVALVVALVAPMAYRWWHSPEHRLAQFVAATYTNNAAERLLALADPTEVQRVGFSPDTFQRMLADAAGVPGIRLGKMERVPLSPRQEKWNRWMEVSLYGNDSKPLLDTSGRPVTGGRPARIMIMAYNTDDGWKIGLTSFLYEVMLSRCPAPNRAEVCGALCHRYGLRPERYLPEGGTWIEMPTGRRLR